MINQSRGSMNEINSWNVVCNKNAWAKVYPIEYLYNEPTTNTNLKRITKTWCTISAVNESNWVKPGKSKNLQNSRLS
jgi:hypothetical protein